MTTRVFGVGSETCGLKAASQRLRIMNKKTNKKKETLMRFERHKRLCDSRRSSCNVSLIFKQVYFKYIYIRESGFPPVIRNETIHPQPIIVYYISRLDTVSVRLLHKCCLTHNLANSEFRKNTQDKNNNNENKFTPNRITNYIFFSIYM